MLLRKIPSKRKVEIVNKELEDYEYPKALQNAKCWFSRTHLECVGFVEWSTLRKIIKHNNVAAFAIVPAIHIYGVPLFAVGFNTEKPTVGNYDIKYFIKNEEKTVDKELELC